ncbi:MAG: hypothetical protein E6767_13295 [Dysgonomonas sp.]|nr:hypothetical protein [Dysgonomonas sp.]
MKKYIFLLAILTSLIFFVSCEEDKLDTYSVENNVYFIHANDSIVINLKGMESGNFVYKTDSIFRIPVRIMGKVSDVDRNISAKATTKDDVKNLDSILMNCPQAIYNTDFEILPSVIPANKETGYLNVKMKNSDKLKETGDTIAAVITLIANDDLKVNYSSEEALKGKKSSLIFRLFFYSNIAEAPRLWALSSKFVTSGVSVYWGNYTPEKFALIVKACSLDPEIFEFTDEEYKTINNITTASINITSGGISNVWNDRFASFDVLSGWRRQIEKFMVMYPEEWDNFPDGKIVWNTDPRFAGISWGTWTKP